MIFGHTRECVAAAANIPNNLESLNLNEIYSNKEYLAIVTTKYALLSGQERQWNYQKRKIDGLRKTILTEINDRWPNSAN